MKNDLKDRDRYEKRIKMLKAEGSLTPQHIGFSRSLPDINRFTARYRLAKSLRSIHLDGYQESTSSAYTALLKVFLAWSAFEVFMTTGGLRQKDTGSLFDRHDGDSVLETIRRTDPKGKVATFLLGKVNRAHADVLASFLKGNSVNVTFFISGIRHVFAHGILTAHPDDASPAAVATVRYNRKLWI